MYFFLVIVLGEKYQMTPAVRAYFNMLTAGANDPAVIRFAPAVITFCLRNINNVIRYFACQCSKMNNAYYL